MISFDDFKKLEIKVARITQAEKIEGSDKLLKLQVSLGGEERQLVAGISQSYSPEELIGRLVVVVSNLEPKTIYGVESQGMLLAVDVDEKTVLLQPDTEVPPGTNVL